MTVRLNAEGVANLLGFTPSTIRAYVSRRQMPQPEPCPCCSQGATWDRQAVLDWQAQRPGRTGRPRRASEPA